MRIEDRCSAAGTAAQRAVAEGVDMSTALIDVLDGEGSGRGRVRRGVAALSAVAVAAGVVIAGALALDLDDAAAPTSIPSPTGQAPGAGLTVPVALNLSKWCTTEEDSSWVQLRCGISEVDVSVPQLVYDPETSEPTPAPDDWVTWLQEHSRVVVVERDTVQVGGLEGTRFILATDEPELALFAEYGALGTANFSNNIIRSIEPYAIVAVPVAGRTLVVTESGSDDYLDEVLEGLVFLE